MERMKKIISALLVMGMMLSSIAVSQVSAAVKEDVRENFLTTGFDGGIAGTGLSLAGKWGADNAATKNNVTIDTTDSTNPCVKLGAPGYNVGLNYAIPTGSLPESYTMDVSFEFKMQDSSNTFYASLFDGTASVKGGSLQNNNQLNNVNLVFTNGGNLQYGENSTYGTNNPQTLGVLSSAVWYKVNSTVVVRPPQRPMVNTVVMQGDTKIGEYNCQLSGKNLASPTQFTLMGQNAYIDNVKIDFIYDKIVSSYDVDYDFTDASEFSNFGRYNRWGEENENLLQIGLETVEENNVVKFSRPVPGSNDQVALDYHLPENLPDAYKMTINYKMLMNNLNDFYLFVAPNGTPTQGKGIINLSGNLTTGTPLAIVGGRLGYYGSHTYPTNAGAFKALENEFSYNKWYDVSVSLDVTGTANPTSTVSILKEGVATPITYTSTIGARDCKSIDYIQWWYNPTTADNYAYVDDISISYEFEENTITDKKFVYSGETEGELTEAPVEKVSGVKLTLANEKNITATLKSASETVEVTVTKNGNENTIAWDKVLKNEAYTLTVDYGAYDPFVYTFTPPKAVFEATALEFYEGETKLTDMSNVSVGDTITLKATFTNETGESEDAVLIIAGYYEDAMSMVDYLPIDVESLDGNVTKTFDFTVTEDMNIDEIKGFVLNSMTGMKPLFVNAEL